MSDASSRHDRDARVVRTRAALRDALAALLGEHRFADITAAMVVARAGVGYATFFRHYPDMVALLTDTADSMIEALTAIVAPPLAAGRPDLAMHLLADHIAANRIVCLAMLTGAGDAVRAAIVRRAVAQATAAPIDLTGDLPPGLAIRFQVATAVEVLGWWLEQAPETPVDEVAALLGRLVIAPVMTGSSTG